MRIAVLASPDSWYLRDLRRAASGTETIVACTFSELSARLGAVPGPHVASGPTVLAGCDAVIVRSMPAGTLEQVVFRMDALARVQQSGVRVLNPPRALEIAIDKYLALARLADAGLRVPPTVTCQTAAEALVAYDQLGGDVVVKPLFGSEGRGIARVSDAALAERAFRLLEQLGAVLYLQQFVPHEGFDLRALVIGDQLLAIRRRNSADWRTNVSRGAIAEVVDLDESLGRMARTAARAVGASVAGVDLLPARDGTVYVLEVNAVPGWKAVARAHRRDVARDVLDYLAQGEIA